MRHFALGAYALVVFLALTWPGYALLGSAPEPRVLGLPFSLAYVVGWTVTTFFVVLTYHLAGAPEER